LEAQICIESVFSFLYFNVYGRFAGKFVENESEHFADCRRAKIYHSLSAGVQSAEKIGNDAVQDLSVEGP